MFAFLACSALLAQRQPASEPQTTAAKPQPRSTAAILQSSPFGVMELARTNRAGTVFRGAFTDAELARVPQVSAPPTRAGAQTSTPASPRGFGAQALPAGIRNLNLFQPDPVDNQPLLYFGEHSSDAVPPTMSRSFFCKGDGSVSFALTGSAFKLKLVRTTEWIDTPGGGTEKSSEYGTSGFKGKSGMQYTVFIEFDPKNLGVQSGQLIITEPKRKILVPVQGEGYSKQLVASIEKISVNPMVVKPGDTFEATLTLNVEQNSPTQLVIAQAADTPVKLAKSTSVAAKPGKSTVKVTCQTSPLSIEDPAAAVAIGLFDAGNGKLLASKVATVALRHEWVEWNYTQKLANQTIWGRFQLASSGEFIWSVEGHNSSWIYPDRVYHAVCLPGQGPKGVGPGTQFQFKLPGKTDRLAWVAVGKLELANWDSAKTTNLSAFSALWDGNPWFDQEKDFADGILDLTGIYQIGGPGLESAAAVGKFSWAKDNRFQPSKVTSFKAWSP